MSTEIFRARLDPAGDVIDVAARESVLDAARRQGINLPHSCRTGSCMSCRGRLLAGEVSYPAGWPAGLTHEEADRGEALLCVAHPDSDLRVEVQRVMTPDTIRIRQLPCRIERRDRLADDVMALHLRTPAVEPMRCAAGQYIDILHDGLRRSFSVASPPEAAGPLEIHVRRVPGGAFTNAVFDTLADKSLLRIEGPLGSFVFDDQSSRPVIMIAGGTGFAPLQAMLMHAFMHRFAPPMHLYWGARTRDGLYREALIQAWRQRHPDLLYTPVLSEPAASSGWSGRTGQVHEAVLADYPDLSGYDVYAAGPPPMITAIQRTFPRRGLPEARLFFDSFDFAPDVQAAIDRRR